MSAMTSPTAPLDDRALAAARNALMEHGIDIPLPSDGDLDDLDRERFDGLCAGIRAYMAALDPAPDPVPEWIEWCGGEMPVPTDTEVFVKYRVRDGGIEERGTPDRAGWFNHLGWWEGTPHVAIVAYRLAPAGNETGGVDG